MDPFAGSGTVGAAAVKLERRFVLYDINPDYVDIIRDSVGNWLGKAADEVLWINCAPTPPVLRLFDTHAPTARAETVTMPKIRFANGRTRVMNF